MRSTAVNTSSGGEVIDLDPRALKVSAPEVATAAGIAAVPEVGRVAGVPGVVTKVASADAADLAVVGPL